MLSPLGPGVPISPRLTLAKMAGVVRHQEVAPKDATSFTDDAECVRYIISTNIHRRHLSPSLRAFIAAEIAQLEHGGDRRSDQAADLPVDTQSDVAQQMQVSERLVRDAKMVQREAPDLAAKVKSGEMKVSKAASMARERTKAVEPSTDKRRAVEMVLGCEKWAGRSDRWIADQVGVNDHTVAKIRCVISAPDQARTGKLKHRLS